MREAVREWRFYQAVLALQAMHGIQFITAVGMISEPGHLPGFEYPRQLIAWPGITPSEQSSGGTRRQGGVIKAGNSYAGKLPVEAGWSYRHPARAGKTLQRRHEGIPKAIIERREMPSSDHARSIANSRREARM
ncbi:hypothetical protein LMG29542_08456 [Paraburkholderia humisilvae]|uniref:Transposase IS116/IS110/IS902 C-terminal domain-containing protein n=1 Tax=Paraburkholderia humisilvae TaxID=627669 RepID=A0A6J5F9B3_9BURK|nr:hypothetical protein LMG29542_08456 [Paraburkholderia humisilvae]